MNKLKINYIIDMFMLVLFAITGVTGILIFYKKELLNIHGIGRLPVATWHSYIGLLFTVIMVLHIILHYKWIINTSKNIIKRR